MADEPLTFPVIEETAHISRRSIETGRVHVRKHVKTETHTLDVPISATTVEITRIPIEETVSEAPSARLEGDTLIIPVIEEVTVVEKRLVVKEEIHIRQHKTTETRSMNIDLNKEQISIERTSHEKEI
jgi:uncharacterized protein (TIGR02271 family)